MATYLSSANDGLNSWKHLKSHTERLREAAQDRDLSAVTLLLRDADTTHIDINYQDLFGVTALHLACSSQHTAIISELLHAGAKPNVTDEYRTTPLHIAASKCYYDGMALLLQH